MLSNNFLKFTWQEQEPAELILSIGFFFFVLINTHSITSFEGQRELWHCCGSRPCRCTCGRCCCGDSGADDVEVEEVEVEEIEVEEVSD